ncbi:hypothetical protein OHA25_48450 [Nonomuraea sp. NBC_00507]|uniref:hypothetical protein n=1 Tax=Nonomuraea sp. NBC_00507 TaxID=2976002 RepID=UPI002E17FF9D
MIRNSTCPGDYDQAFGPRLDRADTARGDERAVSELLCLAERSDEDVRFYVAWSLPLGRDRTRDSRAGAA